MASFYGIDTATLLGAGRNFVDSDLCGSAFSASQLESELPGYVFSSTPLSYVPGVGGQGHLSIPA